MRVGQSRYLSPKNWPSRVCYVTFSYEFCFPFFAMVGRYLSKHRLRIEPPRLFKLQVLFPFVFNLFNVIPFESSGRAGIIADDAFRISLI